MLAALEQAHGDVIIVMEHDDWYRPNHIETCLRELQGYAATGSAWQRYYNVTQRCWRVMRNVGSALCNTAFTAHLMPAMRSACEHAREQNKIGIDRMFWDSVGDSQKNITEAETVVGIKGLPGRTGLGLGHKPDLCSTHGWTSDQHAVKAAEWLGDDVARYAELCAWE